MMSKTTRLDSLTIEGIEYVPRGQATPLVNTEGMPYVIVRSATASPFAGFLAERGEKIAILIQARRIRYWKGAMDLSQLANDGTTDPSKCQFSAPALRVEVPWSEIHHCTQQGATSLQGIPVWKI